MFQNIDACSGTLDLRVCMFQNMDFMFQNILSLAEIDGLEPLCGAPRRPKFPTHRRRLPEHFIALVDFRFLQGCSELKGRPVHYPDRGIINFRARRRRTLPGTERFYFALRGVLRRSTSLPDARSPVCLTSISMFRGPRFTRRPPPGEMLGDLERFARLSVSNMPTCVRQIDS